MNLADFRDLGAKIEGHFAGFVSVTAGGGNDGSEVSSSWIDKRELETGKVLIGYETTLAQDETLSIAANLQDATDNSGTDSADYGPAMSDTVVATGGSGGSTESGVEELDFQLDSANQFVRVQFTPTMSASGTDTANVMAVLILSGADTYPITNKAN